MAVHPTGEESVLRARIAELERENADLRQHIMELREAIEALMQPDSSGNKSR